MAFLPIHETLDQVVAPGTEQQWSAFTADQHGFASSMTDWGNRLGVDVSAKPTLALGLWGDAAPISNRDSIFLLLFSVLSGVCRERFWICTFTKKQLCRCGCKGRCTFDAVFVVIAWMFRALVAGTYPHVNHEGDAFPSGPRKDKAGSPLRVRAACIRLFGDWSWNKQAFGLQGWRAEGPDQRVCWCCGANKFNCYDFTSSAPWRRMRIGMSQLICCFITGSMTHVSSVWSIPGMVVSAVVPDYMHCCCLGILQYLLGNVVYEIFVDLHGTFKKPTEACGMILNMLRVIAKHMNKDPPFERTHCRYVS